MKASHRGNLTPESLERLARAHFDRAERTGDTVVTSFGAIAELQLRPVGRELAVDVRMDPKVPEPVARETINRYNRFLEESTGFSSKERARRIRKAAGSPGA